VPMGANIVAAVGLKLYAIAIAALDKAGRES
jgi:hypothetical protein